MIGGRDDLNITQSTRNNKEPKHTQRRASRKDDNGPATDAKGSSGLSLDSDCGILSGDPIIEKSGSASGLTTGFAFTLTARGTGKAAQRQEKLADTQFVREAHRRISQALEGSDTQNLLQVVWEATQDEAVIVSIPSTTFVEILRQLDPYEDFLPLRHGYKERIPKHYNMLRLYNRRWSKELQRRRTMYWEVFCRRLQAGRDLSLKEYKQLLKCARGTWDGGAALSIMKDMTIMHIRPDLACYNFYFEARCWSDAWSPEARQLLRVIPYTQQKREQISKLFTQSGYTIDLHKTGQHGLKAEVTSMFTQMIEGGTVADANGYGHLITALAREGDMQGVKAVLYRAWDVNVDKIEGDQDIKTPSRLHQSSPLYPDKDLLFVIAHAFSTNNDVSTALKVVDHFSRKFSIPITQDVCTELLQWTYALSTPRYKMRKVDGAQLGQLPRQTVEHLWNVLISEPYCCEPTLPMYDVLIRSFRRRDQLWPMLRYILAAYEVHAHDTQQYYKNFLNASSVQTRESSVGLEADSQGILHESTLTYEKPLVSFVLIHEWFRMLLTGQRFLSKENRAPVWERQFLPDVIDLFWRYKDSGGVEYRMETGTVLLQDSGDRRSFEYLPDLHREASYTQLRHMISHNVNEGPIEHVSGLKVGRTLQHEG
ncbi:MAG: hypothetical protein Q9164_000833 [Protoblastenia rupestris]